MKLYLQHGDELTLLSKFDTKQEYCNYLRDFCEEHNAPYVRCWMNGADTIIDYSSHAQYLVLK